MRKILFLLTYFLLTAIQIYALEAQLSLDQLVGSSEKIVRGKIDSMTSRPGRNAYGDELIYTDISVRSLETLKGQHTDFFLTIEGGTHNGITLKVSDTPEFIRGTEVLLFVKREGTLNVPVSRSQGKLTIGKDGIVSETKMPYRSMKKEIMNRLEKRGKR